MIAKEANVTNSSDEFTNFLYSSGLFQARNDRPLMAVRIRPIISSFIFMSYLDDDHREECSDSELITLS